MTSTDVIEGYSSYITSTIYETIKQYQEKEMLIKQQIEEVMNTVRSVVNGHDDSIDFFNIILHVKMKGKEYMNVSSGANRVLSMNEQLMLSSAIEYFALHYQEKTVCAIKDALEIIKKNRDKQE